jgi:hypothetical protein
MTASDLKALYKRHNPEGLYFDRKTMRFFGDRMANFGVAEDCIKVMSKAGIVELPVWRLYRKRPVNGGLHGHCDYFRQDTGEVVYGHG